MSRAGEPVHGRRSYPHDIRPEALRSVVQTVLKDAAKNGLPRASFLYHCSTPTRIAPAATSLAQLEAMTIVLQHQFWDLVAGDRWFRGRYVVRRYSGAAHRPLPDQGVVDPSVPFGVKFEQIAEPAAARLRRRQNNPSIMPTWPASRSQRRAEADTHDAGACRSAAAGKRNGQAGIRRRSAKASRWRRGREPRPVPQEMKRV